MSFVSISNVHKSYDQLPILKNINIDIEKGELLTLLGPSGCGKSTLLRIIAGLTSLDKGHIIIDGVDVTQLSPKDRELGMVFQDYSLFPNLSVYENIAFGLKMKKVPIKDTEEKVLKMLELVHLEAKRNAYPHELSGGQQQRVALARSLVTQPKLLLLDEPLSALDHQIRKNLQEQLKLIQRTLQMTTIMVTHDQDEAMSISDRIFLMNKGEIVHQGTAQAIYTNPKNEFTAQFIGNYNVLTSNEVESIFNKTTASTNKFAIRPEVISITPLPNGIPFIGTIKEIRMLTNIMQIRLDVQGCNIWIAQLNMKTLTFSIGEQHTFYIHTSDLLELENEVSA